MTALSNEAEILRAVQALEDKLTGVLNTGLQGVNMTIAALTEKHHRAILDQERRNSGFVTLDRFEARYDSLAHRIGELEDLTAGRSIGLLSGINSYLVMAILMIVSNLITFLLGHAVH